VISPFHIRQLDLIPGEQTLIEAFEYKQWADRRTLDAIRSLDWARFPSALKFARQQLNHMVRVEELFRARLLGLSDPHSSTNTEVLPGLPELAERGNDSNQWFASYVRQLEPGHKLQIISFQFVDGLRGTMTRLEILFHIINHSTYHRGALSHALDMAEVPHPADTYPAFIHSAEPARREPPV